MAQLTANWSSWNNTSPTCSKPTLKISHYQNKVETKWHLHMPNPNPKIIYYQNKVTTRHLHVPWVKPNLSCKDLILEIFKIKSFFFIHTTCIHGHYSSLLPHSFKTKPFCIHLNFIRFDAKSLVDLFMWCLNILQFFRQIIIKTLITIFPFLLSLFGFFTNWSL